MSVAEEFATIDLLLNSTAETRAVDAFALALIKAERQLRKLVTHLVYQFDCFGPRDIPKLRNALANKRVYFDGFISGFNALHPSSIETLVGSDHDRLRARLAQATEYRNKIFHGQITKHELSRQDLEALVGDIRSWCERLAASAARELGYDGFARNSFRKSSAPGLLSRLKVQFNSVGDYELFIKNEMVRKTPPRSVRLNSA